MNQAVTQSLENLPDEILSLPRFFAVKENKEPKIKGWSKPENQKPYNEIQGLAGFDTAGHNKGDDYLFLDFDHVLNDNGEFVTVAAEQLFNRIHDQLKSYCELSASKHGIHIIAKPTAGKFKKISSGRNGRIFFNEDETAFLELFYGTGGRYCYFTGDVYQCSPKAPVTHGEAADSAFQELLDIIAARTKKTLKSAQKTTKQQENKMTTIYQTLDERDRALNMLAVVPVADLSRDEWVNVGMALKNNGNSVSDWREWSRADERFKDGECDDLWQGFEYGGGLTIATIHDIAKRYGYQEPKRAGTSAPMNDDQDDNFIWTQDKIKSCPVNLKLPPNYEWGKRGVTLVVPGKKAPKHFLAALTPIVPTRKFREPVKGTLEYEIAILTDGEWCKIEIDGATIGDIRELGKILNRHGGLVDEPKIISQFLNAVIALNSAELPKIKSYNQTGWTNDDCEEFAYPSANGNVVVRRTGFDYEKIFKPKGDRDAWLQKFGEVTKLGGAIARVVIGTACAAPLVRLIEDLPNLQAHLHGKKSIGKTPMLKFAVSIFGDTKVGALTHTFAATPKSRLEFACAFNDLPLICEELESVGVKDAEKLSQDVYNFYLGIGGQALKLNGNLRDPKLFSSARLTSGEHSIVRHNSNGGEFKRVLELRATELLPEDFAAELYGFCNRHHGLFLEQWIRYITEHRDEITADFHFALNAAKRLHKENDATQLKTLVAATVAYQHFKIAIGLQTKKNEKEMYEDRNAIAAELPTATDMDDTKRAEEFLSSYIAGHIKFFVRDIVDKEDGKDKEINAWSIESYGKIFANGEVAILPHALKKILETEGGFISADKLINEWRDKKKLIVNVGRRDHNITLGDRRQRVIHFKANIISTACDSAETGYYEDLGVM